MQPSESSPPFARPNGANVAVLMVNYRTSALVTQGLLALQAIRDRVPNLSVVVVDNGSGDHSVPEIARFIADQVMDAWVHLVDHGRNAGFAAGNNAAISHALNDWGLKVDHFFFLNPDAFVEPDTLSHLLAESAVRHDRALLGTTLVDEHGKARASGFLFPSPISEFQRGAHLGLVAKLFRKASVALPVAPQPYEVDWVTGAGFLMPKAIYDQVGPMDEGYFLYYEEVDYMRSIRSAGFEIWSVPQARIMHIGGAATGISRGKSIRKRMPVYWYESWRRYFSKNHGMAFLWVAGLAWMAGECTHRALSLIRPSRSNDSGLSLGDFARYALLGMSKP